MKSILLMSIVAVLSFPPVVCALEIDIPGLVGEYEYGTSGRSVVIDLGGSSNEITSISLELTGTVHSGWYESFGETRLWGCGFVGQFTEPDPGSMRAHTEDELNGVFDISIDFYSLDGGTWAFLVDGQGLLEFVYSPSPIIIEPDVLGPEPTATIDAATLVITSGPISAETRSWSSVKSLYQ